MLNTHSAKSKGYAGKNGGTVTGSLRAGVAWEGRWDVGRGREPRTAKVGDAQA